MAKKVKKSRVVTKRRTKSAPRRAPARKNAAKKKSVPAAILKKYRYLLGGKISPAAMKLIEREYKKNPGGAFDRCVAEVSKRPGVYSPAGVCATAGRKKYGAKKFAAKARAGKKRANKKKKTAPAYGSAADDKRFRKMHKLGRMRNHGKARRANSLEASKQTYRDFHGRDPQKTIVVKDKIHQHKFLSGIGDLIELRVITPDEKHTVKLTFDDGAVLAQSEKRTQLFIRGGDQSVDLEKFGVFKPYHEKELLGQVQWVDYFTRKDHLRPEDGGEAIYRHKFGGIRKVKVGNKVKRVRSPKPTLVYDSVNKLLEFVGGGYTIPDEGIDN